MYKSSKTADEVHGFSSISIVVILVVSSLRVIAPLFLFYSSDASSLGKVLSITIVRQKPGQ